MGLLGRDAVRGLKQLPSAIYWQGLGTWGIRRFAGSRAQLHRDLARTSRRGAVAEFSDPDEEPIRRDRLAAYWDPHLPTCPRDLWERSSLRLTHEEADYLRARILTAVPDSLLAWVVGLGAATNVAAPWGHPLRVDFLPAHQEQLFHGKAFSVSIRGAVILYNLMLAEQKTTIKHNGEAQPETDPLVDRYRDAFAGWGAEMEEAAEELAQWNRSRFWQIVLDTGARVSRTAAFVDTWLDMALARNAALIDDASARKLVRDREMRLKGKLSRFTNERSLEIWSEAAGMRRIDYRWSTVQTLVKDIVDGMEA